MATSLTRAWIRDEQPADMEDDFIERDRLDDECAFDWIVQRHQEHISNLVYRLLGWNEPEVQDVFLAAFKNLHRFRREASMQTWLTSITVNACRSWRRKRLLRLKLQRAVKDAPPVGYDKAHGPDGKMLGREAFERVQAAVRSLPNRLREVMVLRYLQELPIEEVAEVLGITTNAVNVRLSRGRKRLKSKLEGIM